MDIFSKLGSAAKWPLYLVLIFCVLFSININAQEIYRWVDDKGKVHYGDRPPTNQKADNITDSANATNVDTSQSEQQKLGKLFAKETPEEKAFREQKEAQEQRRAKQIENRCNKARENLRFFTEERFYWKDEDGKGRNATEEERDETIKKIQAFLRDNC